MDCCKLPHGNQMLSTLGLELGVVHEIATAAELREIFAFAIDRGINFFYVAWGHIKTYSPFG